MSATTTLPPIPQTPVATAKHGGSHGHRMSAAAFLAHLAEAAGQTSSPGGPDVAPASGAATTAGTLLPQPSNVDPTQVQPSDGLAALLAPLLTGISAQAPVAAPVPHTDETTLPVVSEAPPLPKSTSGTAAVPARTPATLSPVRPVAKVAARAAQSSDQADPVEAAGAAGVAQQFVVPTAAPPLPSPPPPAVAATVPKSASTTAAAPRSTAGGAATRAAAPSTAQTEAPDIADPPPSGPLLVGADAPTLPDAAPRPSTATHPSLSSAPAPADDATTPAPVPIGRPEPDSTRTVPESRDSTAAAAAPGPAVKVTATTAGDAPTGSPAQQVLTALRDLGLPAQAANAAEPAEAMSASQAAPTGNPSGSSGVARSLTIQLTPEHLGPVAVTLRMKADGIDVKISVASPEALHALERDRHLLTAAVQAVGGKSDLVQISAATPNDLAGSAGTTSSFPGQSGPSSDAQAGGQPRHQQRSDASSPVPNARHDDPSTAAPSSPDRGDGSLYL